MHPEVSLEIPALPSEFAQPWFCIGSGWDGVNFLRSSPYGAGFWIGD